MPAPSVTTPEKKAKTEWELLLGRAEKGEINAQLEVAYEYWKGEKVAQSLEKAVYWWTKGAEGNSAEARAFLGACYMEGKGVQKDVSVGLRLIEIAASQGFGNACYMLAIAYEKGDGVERNYDVAYSWYQKALRTELSEGLEKEVWKTLAKYEESRCPSCETFFAKEGKPTIFGTEYFCRKCGYKY